MRLGRVFVANRGEIAARVARGCADAGIACVVPDLPSYLDGAAIIAAALDAGADALHPGYGFLSENADFARAVVAAGLTWIGPSAEVIELMGRKDRAREVAARAGVPVVPRFDPDNVLGDAYPVLVKAASGGGGKGMHMVRDAADLSGALATAAREASKAFGDDTLLIERFVEGGRHIEVQVFGDGDGNVVHLFERDCSVQRRHQKILEEAPAPNLDPTVRQVVLDSAVALCREVGYVNAGTVEFLVRGTEVFFLEMNTRLQVEHPVTEEVTGIDLVRWQLAVAAGEALPLAQEQITCTGHAIEARIYAEDPYAGFLPQAGQIVAVQWPWQVRVETAVDGPTRVTTDFDPMLAKIIVAAESREAAIDELVAALDETIVEGLTTNTGFVRRVADSAEFRGGTVHTGWLDTYDGPLMQRPPASEAVAATGAAALVMDVVGPAASSPVAMPAVYVDARFSTLGSRTQETPGWRSAGPAAPVYVSVRVEGELRRVEPNAVLPYHRVGPRVWVADQGQVYLVEQPDGMRRLRAAAAGDADVIAPMPGTVVAVEVVVGDVVDAGQKLGVLEAMKMELTLKAAHAGTVTVVSAEPGAQVRPGHVLFHVEPLGA